MNETDARLKRKLKDISNAIVEEMPEENIAGVTRKMGMNRKTAHSYPKLFEGKFVQVRDIVILESTWLGYFEPYSKRSISSLIHDVISKDGQGQLIKQYGLNEFQMNVLDPSRAICEKIMSLVRFSYTEDPITDLKNKIRHTYDLNQLLKDAELSNFIKSDEFELMLIKVAQDDVKSFRNNNLWLENHPINSMFFEELSSIWESDLKAVYENDFKNLVYGDFPRSEIVLECLVLIKDRIKELKWDIKVSNEDK